MTQFKSHHHNHIIVTRNRLLFDDNANETLSLSINPLNDSDSKNTKRYFTVEPKFQTDGGFDLTVDKINIPDQNAFLCK